MTELARLCDDGPGHRARIAAFGGALFLLGFLCGCPKPCEDSVPGLAEARVRIGVESAANDILAMDDGGYLITGQAISEGGFLGLGRVDLYLARVDAGFNVQWSKTYGGPRVDEGLRIEAAADGGYIVLGSTDQQSVLEGGFYHTVLFALLMKFDASGEVQWSQKIEEGLYSSGYDICTNPDGTIAVAVYVGYTFSSGNEFGESEVFLIKFDGDGRELWRRAYRAGGRAFVDSVSATADGGYILAGSSGRSAHIVKVDADGRETWQLTTPPDLEFGDLANLFDARRVIQTSDGGFAFVCRANTYYDSAILKLGENGEFRWRIPMPGGAFVSGYDLAEAPDGTIVAVGEASPNTPGIDKRRCARLYAVRIAADGNLLWSEKLGGNFSSVANGVALDAAGNAVLAGSRYEAGVYTTYLLLTDAGLSAGSQAEGMRAGAH